MLSLGHLSVLLLLFLLLSLFSLTCYAQQFIFVGPRAMAMGGAHVAACRDASAMYWNPAALALVPDWQFKFMGGSSAQIPDGIFDAIDLARDYDLDSADVVESQDTVGEILTILEKIQNAKHGVLADPHAGFYFKAKHFGLAVSDMAVVGMTPHVDLQNIAVGFTSEYSIHNNETELTALAVEPREAILSYAHSVIPGGEFGLGPFTANVLLGASAKLINTRTYYLHKTLWDYDPDDDNLEGLIDEFQRENRLDSTTFSADLGALVTLGDRISVGATARNITEPKFDFGVAGEPVGEVEFEALYRAGVSVKPFKPWLLAFDVDLTESDSGVEDYDIRTASLGTEFTFAKDIIALRAGVFDNVAESSKPFITAGLGLNLKHVTFDLAGGRDTSHDDNYAVSASFGATM